MQGKRAEIVDYLMIQMIGHSLKKGDKLPSENELAEMFRTTRINVRTAMERLVEMGYIQSFQGRGYYVKGQKQKIGLVLSGKESFSQKMVNAVHGYESINLGCSRIAYDEPIWMGLGIEKSRSVYEIKRLRVVEGEPVALHISYLTADYFPNIEKQGGQIVSMFDYYHTNGYTHFNTRQSILSITFPTLSEQQVFKCSGLVPLLLLETDCVDVPTGRILEMTKILYKGDSFQYLL